MRLQTPEQPEHILILGRPRSWKWLAVSLILLLCSTTAASQATASTDSMVITGTVGSYAIGLNYTTRNHSDLVAAHYFYASQLKNIPLTGAVHGEAIDLQGSDGSTFHLHFVGNGSNGKDPLTFYNSVGLAGTWVQGSRTLPVKLSGGYSTANPGQRIYADVTDKSDTDFEHLVQATRSAILAGDRKTTGSYIDFPMRVNLNSGHLTIRNADQLQAQWSRIFPPALIDKLKITIPHEMFVHNGQAMLGDGELWFGDKGLDSVNAAF